MPEVLDREEVIESQGQFPHSLGEVFRAADIYVRSRARFATGQIPSGERQRCRYDVMRDGSAIPLAANFKTLSDARQRAEVAAAKTDALSQRFPPVLTSEQVARINENQGPEGWVIVRDTEINEGAMQEQAAQVVAAVEVFLDEPLTDERLDALNGQINGFNEQYFPGVTPLAEIYDDGGNSPSVDVAAPVKPSPLDQVSEGVKIKIQTSSAWSIADKVALLSLKTRKWGTTKKVASASITTDANPEFYSVSKRLIACDEYAAVKVHFRQVRDYIERFCLPSQFRAGVYMLPYKFVDTVDAYLEAALTEHQNLVAAFIAVYDEKIGEARGKLGSMFSERDYPSAAYVQDQFSLYYEYTMLTTPSGLGEVRKEIFQREQRKAQKQWQETGDEVKQLLAQQAADLAGKVLERLTPGEDGKPKQFKNSLIDNWNEFLETFDAKNITDDADLARVIGQARAAISGKSAEDLRSNADYRSAIVTSFAAVEQELETMVTRKPGRMFRFDEGDED